MRKSLGWKACLLLLAGLAGFSAVLGGFAGCAPSATTSALATSATQAISPTLGPSPATSATTGTTVTPMPTLPAPPTRITYAYPGFANPPYELSLVEDEVNRLALERINVQVGLLPLNAAAYGEEITRLIAAGESPDLLLTPPDGPYCFSSLVASGMALDLSDRIKAHGLGVDQAIQNVNPALLAGTTINGRLYGLPALTDYSSALYFAIRQDALQQHGLDLASLQSALRSAADLQLLLAELKSGTSIPVLGTSAGGQLLVYPDLSLDLTDLQASRMLDTLGDSQFGLGAVLGQDNRQVMNYFSSEAYKTLTRQAHEWYEAGYVYEDAAGFDGEATDLVAAGKALGFFFVGDYGSGDKLTARCGHAMMVCKVADIALTSGRAQRNVWVLPSAGGQSAAALDFLGLTYEDAAMTNLLEYGLEDRHYIEQGGKITYPPGATRASARYAVLEKDFLGNPYLAKIWWTDDADYYTGRLAANQKAVVSPLLGFTADTADLRPAILAVRQVLAQYRPGFESGKIDPDDHLAEFLADLEAAGYPAILQSIQKQVDAFK